MIQSIQMQWNKDQIFTLIATKLVLVINMQYKNSNETKLGMNENLTFEAPDTTNLLMITNLGPPLVLTC